MKNIGSKCGNIRKKFRKIVVFDTMVNEVNEVHYANRPWGADNNPGTAVAEFLSQNARFEADMSISNKLQISACPGGYLKCVAD